MDFLQDEHGRGMDTFTRDFQHPWTGNMDSVAPSSLRRQRATLQTQHFWPDPEQAARVWPETKCSTVSLGWEEHS